MGTPVLLLLATLVQAVLLAVLTLNIGAEPEYAWHRRVADAVELASHRFAAYGARNLRHILSHNWACHQSFLMKSGLLEAKGVAPAYHEV
jgi:hypothetical protein